MPELVPRFQEWFKKLLPYFWHNWVCAIGSITIIATLIILLFFLLFFIYNVVLDRHISPYVQLVSFMIMPSFLILGIITVLIGNIIHRRRVSKGQEITSAPELGGQILLKKALLVGFVSLVSIMALGTFGYEAYHFTDSTNFCATVCHEVMAPEAISYSNSPHSNVNCVKCHIGPGASWFVRAKISGLRQVYGVLTDSYSKPIESPVQNLRPARDTCEVCHKPDKFHGSKMVVRKHFEYNQENTETITANIIYIGGPSESGQASSGVHWHVDPENEVRYRFTDRERHNIVEVVQKTPDGEIRYIKDGFEGSDEEGEWRVMDCLDCHNRPTHIYELPEKAVDESMASGKLDSSIPWLAKESLRTLLETVPSENTEELIKDKLIAIYTEDHPDDLQTMVDDLDAIAIELTDILERNVFPAMKIEWGTYKSNLSHFDGDDELGTVGCFRCHDDEHQSEDGHYIDQDCDKCHNLMAYQEEDWEGFGGIDIESFLRN
jgi:hypothetical protein